MALRDTMLRSLLVAGLLALTSVSFVPNVSAQCLDLEGPTYGVKPSDCDDVTCFEQCDQIRDNVMVIVGCAIAIVSGDSC
ncbi:MAG: hypothetical protein WC876_04070 [Candidatus Thermoplasmatota archaeon]|jgi:hypothetical protein